VQEARDLNFYEKLMEKVRRGGYTGSRGEGKRRRKNQRGGMMRRERKVASLSELTEEQRAEAYKRYEVVRGCVEEEVPQTVVAREYGVPVKTVDSGIAIER
jgi:hypothetical protein